MFCLISICFCLIGLLLVLWFLGLYLTVYVCIFLILSLFFFSFVCSVFKAGLFAFLMLTCLFSKDREKVWSWWVQEGDIWEKLGEVNIFYEKNYFQ